MDVPRVMLLAPQYWISGTVTLTYEMRLGWPMGWPRARIACPTKSGRPSTQWGRPASEIRRATSTGERPEITGSADDIYRIARESFDMIIVTEPDIPASHRDWWHGLLERLPVPWALVLNGNRYPDVRWDRIIEAPKFTGVVWHTPGHMPQELIDVKATIVSLPRPYTLKYAVRDQLRRRWHPVYGNRTVVGTHCRVAPDKGVALVAALSKHIQANVCIDGAPQAGAVPYTLAIQRRYLPDEYFVPAEARWTTPSYIGPNGCLHYTGPFTAEMTPARHHDVHVSATHRGFSAGHEYSVLEAIDAGCVIVQPRHMSEPECGLRQYTYEWEQRGVVGALQNEHVGLSKAVRAALIDAESPSGYGQRYNREAVQLHHDPDRLIRTFMGEVLDRL